MRKIIDNKAVRLLTLGVLLALAQLSGAPRVVSAGSGGDSVVIASGDAPGVVEAIQAANQRGTGATPYEVYLGAGEYDFYAPDQADQPSLPEVTGNLTIYGQSSSIVFHNSRNALGSAQLRVAAGATVQLHNLIFLVQSGSGRAIFTRGALVISDSQFGESLGEGGGIENQGSLTLERTVFTHNRYTTSIETGGALYNSGTLVVTCTRFANGLASKGGAIFNTVGGTVSVTKSAFDGNRANGGGAIFNETLTSVIATDDWWSTGAPVEEQHYRSVDTVSRGVVFKPTAATDPTQSAECQPQAPVQP